MYRSSYLSADAQTSLCDEIDQQPWLNDLKRRVQHYGYKYDYKARKAQREDFLGPLPLWLARLATGLTKEGIFDQKPDQAIVNEYLPGQGIADHVDCVPCFEDRIISLSLGSYCEMRFTHLATRERRYLNLEPGSLLLLSGEARYDWQHGIVARKSDPSMHGRDQRTRRVSITFRRMKFGGLLH